MRKHHGMRPQDIVVLLKISCFPDKTWFVKDVANELGISQGEVSESLRRSGYAELLAADNRTLMRAAFLDFLFYGLKYVFPARPGEMTPGVPTAHSAAPLSENIHSSLPYVWPDSEGELLGQAIQPLHSGVPQAAKKSEEMHQLLALVDALRVGKTREVILARDYLTERIGYGAISKVSA